MTKPVYYQVEQRVCGAWSPTKKGRIIILSGSFRDLLDTVYVGEYQRIKKLDPNKLPADWTPCHIHSHLLRRVLDHQRFWNGLSRWRRALYSVLPFTNPYVAFVNLVTEETTHRHTCRSLAMEQATYLLLFQRLDDEGTYENVPKYLEPWRDKAREGCADAACRFMVCRSEQGHDGEFLDVYWSSHGT